MRATRRVRAVGAVGALLALAALLFDRPWLLAGAAGVAAWLLAVQVAFGRSLARLDDALAVELHQSAERVATDEPLDVTLSVGLAIPNRRTITVALDAPVALRTDEEASVTLEPGETSGTATATVRAPVAGVHEITGCEVTVRDTRGLFEQTFRRDTTATVTAEPRAPRNVHVGQAGEEIAVAFGEHDAGRLGSGLEPAEIREYVPGDAANRIDWKATARLDHPHVREFEAETDRTSVLVFDHRYSMGVGPAGETMLAYAREVALAFLASARELDDPLGITTVGDEGLTHRVEPGATAQQYRRIRTALTDLDPTPRPQVSRPEGRSPAAARRDAAALEGETAFDRRLRPFLADATPYLERVEEDPLFAAVSTTLTRLRGTVWTVIVTDDSNRAELREAVKVARRGDDHVLVFLTPAVLFEREGLADLEAAYDRYSDFERFRRELDRLERVSAFEVSPGDRLHAVLDARRQRRGAAGGDA